MYPVVTFSLVAARESSTADCALEGAFAGVSSHVRRQVVAPTEGALADRAGERLLSGVDADVAGQLIGSGEKTLTVGRWAGVKSTCSGCSRRSTGSNRRRRRLIEGA